MERLSVRYSGYAFVTGASSGVGKAFAIDLAEKGFNLFIISEDEQGLQNTQEELTNINPSIRIKSFCIDLNNIEAVQVLLTNPEFNQVAMVVNCAGIGVVGAVLNNPLHNYLRVINVDAIAPFIISYFFSNLFFQNGTKGAIVNITTANSEIGLPIPNCSVYTPAKYFMKFFTEGLAYEMKTYQIDILNVACGPTDTNFQNIADTNRLSWCESPLSVVQKTFKALGKKSTITTNPLSKILIKTLKVLPLPRNTKIAIASYFYGKILGGGKKLVLRRDKK